MFCRWLAKQSETSIFVGSVSFICFICPVCVLLSYDCNSLILFWGSSFADHLCWHCNQGLWCLYVVNRLGGTLGQKTTGPMLLKISGTGQLDLNKRISLPRLHGLRDLVSIFSLIRSASLVCSSSVSCLLQIWSLPSPCPSGSPLHRVLCKLIFVHDMTTVSICSLLHSWMSVLTTTASTRLAHPLSSLLLFQDRW